MNKPGQFFGFLVALGIAVFALSIVLPSGKAELGPFELGYYHPKDLLGPFWTGETSVAAGVDHGADPLGLDSIHWKKRRRQILWRWPWSGSWNWPLKRTD